MSRISRIGTAQCPGCGVTGRLLDMACPECRRKFGPGCGPVMHGIRTNGELALRCYLALSSGGARTRFIAMFGDPRGPMDPRDGSTVQDAIAGSPHLDVVGRSRPPSE